MYTNVYIVTMFDGVAAHGLSLTTLKITYFE